MTVPSYFKYWGKARPAGDATTACHLLPYHCLDVAAVGAVYLRRHHSLRRLLMQALQVSSEEALIGWLAFWLALHDLGKFSEAFQSQIPDLFLKLRERAPDPGKPYGRMRHDSLGMLMWNSQLLDLAKSDGWFGADSEDREEGLAWWARAVTGHHGEPPRSVSIGWKSFFDPQEDRAAIVEFVGELRSLLLAGDSASVASLLEADLFELISQCLCWWVAGVTVLADWLGSNTDYFPYCDDPIPLSDYWLLAQERAEQALSESGVLPPSGATELGFSELFPAIAQASPLQKWAAEVELAPGPQIHLLEDVTGAGKTEAAMMLAHRLMATGAADGFFIGLPTMATANAMYQRIAAVYARLFAGDASLVLAHCNRNLVENFATSVVRAGPEESDSAQQDESASARCSAWLADHNKRALLAPAGVGTVDQALLAVLHSKHQSLRLLGLFRKVLVVDEVHACDPYMLTVLESLLEFHALGGGSAILLSATLPAGMKRQLLGAFARGRRQKAPPLMANDFPLVTAWQSEAPDQCVQQAIATRDDVRRELAIHYVSDEAEVLAGIGAALAAGKCVCWMRNTVADAISAYEHFRDLLPAEKMILFHARFSLDDRLRIEEAVLHHFGKDSTPELRAGRLVIATQVAEQSLDADWDFIVTDLAPIDRIIQRTGRLQRHPRDGTGRRLPDPRERDQRGPACLWVFGPAWDEQPGPRWFKEAFPKAAGVYPHHGRLWLTAKHLRAGKVSMPEDSRSLVEGVFGDEAALPEGLQGNANKAVGADYSAISIAQQNVVKLATGYVRGQVMDWWSEAKTPSRLGDASMSVLLACWDGDRLRPWVDRSEIRAAWAYSSLRVAERLIARRASAADSTREAAIAQVEQSLPGKGAWSVLLILEQTKNGWQGSAWTAEADKKPAQLLHWVYDPLTGLSQLAQDQTVSEEAE